MRNFTGIFRLQIFLHGASCNPAFWNSGLLTYKRKPQRPFAHNEYCYDTTHLSDVPLFSRVALGCHGHVVESGKSLLDSSDFDHSHIPGFLDDLRAFPTQELQPLWTQVQQQSQLAPPTHVTGHTRDPPTSRGSVYLVRGTSCFQVEMCGYLFESQCLGSIEIRLLEGASYQRDAKHARASHSKQVEGQEQLFSDNLMTQSSYFCW